MSIEETQQPTTDQENLSEASRTKGAPDSYKTYKGNVVSNHTFRDSSLGRVLTCHAEDHQQTLESDYFRVCKPLLCR